MIQSEYLDTLFYHLASLVALSGFGVFHCYFMFRESYDDVVTIGSDFNQLDEDENINPVAQVFYNVLWRQGEIFDQFRVI